MGAPHFGNSVFPLKELFCFFPLSAFVLFLDYLYCIEDPNESHGLTSQIAPTLLHLAIHYSVTRLVSDVEEFFLKELSQINLLQVFIRSSKSGAMGAI